jgi:predicted metal-dependent phosphoesterase TrpH
LINKPNDSQGDDDLMIIDMHNHTNYSSPCSIISAEDLIEEARKCGLDAICVTEHLYIEGANVAREIGQRMGFPVFRGVEAQTQLGDMLVFGYYQDIQKGISLEDLCWIVHEVGGVVIPAHPFHVAGGWNLYAAARSRGIELPQEWNRLPTLLEFDGVEVCNGQVPPEKNMLAEQLARYLGVPGIGGSDAHSLQMVGKAATKFDRTIHSDEELVSALKEGCYRPIRLKPMGIATHYVEG